MPNSAFLSLSPYLPPSLPPSLIFFLSFIHLFTHSLYSFLSCSCFTLFVLVYSVTPD